MLRKGSGIQETDNISAMSAQIENLNKKFDSLMSINSVKSSNGVCDICAGIHCSIDCPMRESFPDYMQEQVNQVNDFNRQRNNPYSNTYNPGWRQHPNFQWSNTQNIQNPPPRPQAVPFQPQEKKSSVEDLIAQLAQNTNNFMQATQTSFQNQQASIRNLEVQMGQIANVLNEREKGSLPSQIEVNPKKQEQLQAITLRSGKEVNNSSKVDISEIVQPFQNLSGVTLPEKNLQLRAWLTRMKLIGQLLCHQYFSHQFHSLSVSSIKMISNFLKFLNYLRRLILIFLCLTQ